MLDKVFPGLKTNKNESYELYLKVTRASIESRDVEVILLLI